MNFKIIKFPEVLNDCQTLQDLGENVNKTIRLFLIKEKSTMKILYAETNQRFSQASIEFDDMGVTFKFN
ncbi:unnamed protein product [Rotaria magnacalcarata]|uniref:Uncharacterized protein n=1 Tax=Rotaria magnacalcarata TaxID=392030 RepID=A0A819MST2_9BILA|nr:unnamed protein product [Rotaria magnacalcarata]